MRLHGKTKKSQKTIDFKHSRFVVKNIMRSCRLKVVTELTGALFWDDESRTLLQLVRLGQCGAIRLDDFPPLVRRAVVMP